MSSQDEGAGDSARQVHLLADLVRQVEEYAIIALDPQGTIISWNTGAQRLKGHTEEQALGRSFAMFYDNADQRSGLPAELLREAARKGHVEHQGWRVRRDGTRFWGDVTITALQDPEGRHTGYAKVTRDLTRQHDLEVRLRESEERLRLLVGQVEDYAIIALDPQGTIETWNLGAERLKGYTTDEAIGRSFAMFYSADDQQQGLPFQLLETARTQGRAQHTGWRVRRDGQRFWADVTITALRDADQRLTGFAKVTRDRTDVKRLEEAQDAFYANFTHDFRTPVAVIKGFVEALRDVGDDPDMREHLLDRVEAGADRLSTMVEGLVDFARQRVERLDVAIADLDLADSARTTLTELGPAVTGDRVTVDGSVVLARANGDAMQRVVSNLVINALKYSRPDAPVRVAVEQVGDHVELRVRDRGRGIHPDDLATIFDQFERGRFSSDDGGSGLGLASVRDLVERQHGTIELTSTVGEGTEVLVRLPASAVPPEHEGTSGGLADGAGDDPGQASAGQPGG